MNFSSTSEECDQIELSKMIQNKAKINRLKRSPKASQLKPKETDFKTPTRLPTSRLRSWTTIESPNNDTEFQQDIIWDPTSPSTPFRNGHSRRRNAHLKSLDILDIVSRIAPENRKPEEADSSLLQWIGDSAVPCTPEVREPLTRPKTTRRNFPGDLLNLAKQFDFNMIHQEEVLLRQHRSKAVAAVTDEGQELCCKENCPPAVESVPKVKRAPTCLDEARTNICGPLDDMVQGMDEDLDMLFDDSTLQASSGGYFSQALTGTFRDVAKSTPDLPARPAGSTDANEPASTTAPCSVVAGVGGDAEAPVAAPLPSNSKPGESMADDFEDDWSSDDLLQDSFVFEVTQNPELFSASQRTSTERRMNKGGTFFMNTNCSLTNGTRNQQAGNSVNCNSSQGPSQRFQSRQTFRVDTREWNRLPSNENVLERGIAGENDPQRQIIATNQVGVSCTMRWNASQCRRSSSGVSGQPQVQRPSGTSTFNSTRTDEAVNKTSPVSCNFSSSRLAEQTGTQPITEGNGPSDFTDDDLDSIFASDGVWDDGADDDDLLCEVCEKVEETSSNSDPPWKASGPKSGPVNRVQDGPFPSAMETGQKRESPFVQPRAPNVPTRNAVPTKACESLRAQGPVSIRTLVPPAGGLPQGSASLGNTVDIGMVASSGGWSKKPYRFTHVKNTSAVRSTISSSAQQQLVCERGVASSHQSSPTNHLSHDHPFKTPYYAFNSTPVSRDVSQTTVAVGRCSDAEIEKKKQQAKERRRLRMLANQNVRAPM